MNFMRAVGSLHVQSLGNKLVPEWHRRLASYALSVDVGKRLVIVKDNAYALATSLCLIDKVLKNLDLRGGKL